MKISEKEKNKTKKIHCKIVVFGLFCYILLFENCNLFHSQTNIIRGCHRSIIEMYFFFYFYCYVWLCFLYPILHLASFNNTRSAGMKPFFFFFFYSLVPDNLSKAKLVLLSCVPCCVLFIFPLFSALIFEIAQCEKKDIEITQHRN